MKTIRLKIQNGEDRHKVIIALAVAGYRVKEESRSFIKNYSTEYYVIFDVTDDDVR